MKIADLTPSQLYINLEKLNAVNDHTFDSIPVIRLNDFVVMTDGHTRVMAAILAGRDEIQTHWDVDALDLEAYRICVQWCLDEGIKTPYDLRDRIISAEEYESLWLDRCKAMHARKEAQ